MCNEMISNPSLLSSFSPSPLSSLELCFSVITEYCFVYLHVYLNVPGFFLQWIFINQWTITMLIWNTQNYFYILGNSYRDILNCCKRPFYHKGHGEDSSTMDAYIMHSVRAYLPRTRSFSLPLLRNRSLYFFKSFDSNMTFTVRGICLTVESHIQNKRSCDSKWHKNSQTPRNGKGWNTFWWWIPWSWLHSSQGILTIVTSALHVPDLVELFIDQNVGNPVTKRVSYFILVGHGFFVIWPFSHFDHL